MKSILQSELNQSVKLGEVEFFTAEQLKQFATDSYNEIQKSTDGKEALYKEVADEVKSFTPIMVIDDSTLSKSIKFIRPAQIAWDEVEGDEICKARGGTYMNTLENRKKGRVGKRYGEHKEEQGKSSQQIREDMNNEASKKELEGKEQEQRKIINKFLSENSDLKYNEKKKVIDHFIKNYPDMKFDGSDNALDWVLLDNNRNDIFEDLKIFDIKYKEYKKHYDLSEDEQLLNMPEMYNPQALREAIENVKKTGMSEENIKEKYPNAYRKSGFAKKKEGGEKKQLPEKGTPDWHKLEIAKKTVKMNPVMVGVMGGPSIEEAQKTLREYGLSY
jgi:hypothetical protein